jgi:sulfite exporter TauE/SafE
MISTFVTYLQIFGIGFSFGIAGPCFLTCAPVLVTYIAGSKRGWGETYIDILTFLSGRLMAYLLLGALAGLSGAVLKKFTAGPLSLYLQPVAGVITILFAVILITNKGCDGCACPTGRQKVLSFGGIFAFGFLIGVSPCAPLLALLLDIALMARGICDGVFYALFFGLGTFLSGLITVGVIAGILTRVPVAFIKSKTANTVFRIICALLLLAMGLGLILGSNVIARAR